MDGITFTPIGHVRNSATSYTSSEDFRRLVSEIVVDPAFSDGLMDVEQNELLTIVFFFHLNDGYQLKLHPRGDQSRPITGVFNTRSQFRPNPIGVTVVKLKARKGNTLVVEGLDALDGTPVLDIKPFVRTFDEGKEIDDPREDRVRRAR
jgi:tRNA-Thr(GGU) m(6)t(6)A37 methyltransferase TsaA